jgi:hypothetical protein
LNDSARPDTANRTRLHCSFCGKTADHVRFLTAGHSGGMICDICCAKAFLIFLKAHVVSVFKFGIQS